MLADFQQALADLTGSPELCLSVRRDPSILRQKYELTEREWHRLVGIVQHRGMECACIVYRANRLAPLALNIPRTCKALGQGLRDLVSEFWAKYPETNVHFFVETDRFCRFLKAKLAEGRVFETDISPILGLESAAVAAALRESYTETD
ncbi:MAG TPA: hypothetical protein VN950_16945 [Terriglobales bacterium]|nr:hypothetical protein [Terriglobales bacterium]